MTINIGTLSNLRRLKAEFLQPTNVRYGAGRGGFSLWDPAITPARGQLVAVPLCPV